VNYLLDTNVCIELINGKQDMVRIHFEAAIASGSAIYVSTIASFELWYGAWNSEQQARNKLRIESFFVAKVQSLPFDERDAQEAGALRNELRAIGQPIGPYDLLIAAQARARNLVLVSHNVREFGRVDGLRVHDWHV
jgi:tRNA(fMet)-specific endonuclease VapC